MAPPKCCVGGCHSTSDTHKLYSFPKKDQLRSLWLEFVAPTNPSLLVLDKYQLLNRRICDRHFDKAQIDCHGRRLSFGYPCLFTDEEIAHGVPLSTSSGDFLSDHNYCQEEDEDDHPAEYEIIVQKADPAANPELERLNYDHNYSVGTEAKYCMVKTAKVECADESMKDTSPKNFQSFDRNSYPLKETKKTKLKELVTTHTFGNRYNYDIDKLINCGIHPNYNGTDPSAKSKIISRVKVKEIEQKNLYPAHLETNFHDECVDQSSSDSNPSHDDPSAMDTIISTAKVKKNDRIKLSQAHLETNFNDGCVDQSSNDNNPCHDADQTGETLPTLTVTDSDPILLEDAHQPGLILLDGDQQGLMDESQLDVDLHVEEEQSGKETYICDGCGVAISGARYACVQCERDECVTCASSGPQHPHYVLRVPNTANNCEARAVIAAVRRIVRDCLDPPQVKIEVKDEEDDPQPEYYIEELDSDSAILHLTSDNIQQNSDEETDIPSRLCIPDTNIHPETTSSTKTRPQTIPGRTRSSVKNSKSFETSKTNNDTIKIKTRVSNPLKSFRQPAKSTDNFIVYSSVTEDRVSINLTPVCNETSDPINITPDTVDFAPNSANIDPTAIKFAPVPVDFAPIPLQVAPNAVEFTSGRFKSPHVPIIVRPHPYKHTRRKGQSSDCIMLADFFKPASVRLDRLDPATIAAVTSTCDSGLR